MRRAGAIAAVVLGLASWLQAGRPLVIDDAEAAPKGKFQFELGLSYTGDGGWSHFDLPAALTYGLMDNLEIGIGLGWQYERREDARGGSEHEDGIGDIVLGAKWKFLTQEKAWFDHALSASVKFPTASHERDLGSGQADIGVLWIGTRRITEKLFVDLNVAYTWCGCGDDEGSDTVLYGAAARYQISDKFTIVAEVFAQKEIEWSTATAVFVNAGVQWTVCDGLTLDAAVGTGVCGDSPDVFATLGLTWEF